MSWSASKGLRDRPIVAWRYRTFEFTNPPVSRKPQYAKDPGQWGPWHLVGCDEIGRITGMLENEFERTGLRPYQARSLCESMPDTTHPSETLAEAAKRLEELNVLGPGATMGIPKRTINTIARNEGMSLEDVQRSLTKRPLISDWNWDCTHLVFTLYKPHKD